MFHQLLASANPNRGHKNDIRVIWSPYKIIFGRNDRLRTVQTVQIDICKCVHIDRIIQFEHLLIENRWNDRIGYRLG